jgi:hypothetical protein
MTARVFRLVRNLPMERFARGAPQPFAPLFDVEEVDDLRLPVRVIASAVGAEDARAIIARVDGVEVRR